jgi:hypothetical protein
MCMFHILRLRQTRPSEAHRNAPTPYKGEAIQTKPAYAG